MEHAGEPNRLAGLDSERHDVLDLEIDHVADAHAVPQTVVVNLDRRSLDAKHLAHERGKCGHGASQLAAEDLHELVELLVCRPFVDEHP